MLITRSTVLAMMGILAIGEPCLAATCNMTVQGASVLDDASCVMSGAPGHVAVEVASGGTIDIIRSTMSVRTVADRLDGRRRRPARSYGQVLTSVDSDDKTCYANSKVVLCIEP